MGFSCNLAFLGGGCVDFRSTSCKLAVVGTVMTTADFLGKVSNPKAIYKYFLGVFFFVLRKTTNPINFLRGSTLYTNNTCSCTVTRRTFFDVEFLPSVDLYDMMPICELSYLANFAHSYNSQIK